MSPCKPLPYNWALKCFSFKEILFPSEVLAFKDFSVMAASKMKPKLVSVSINNRKRRLFRLIIETFSTINRKMHHFSIINRKARFSRLIIEFAMPNSIIKRKKRAFRLIIIFRKLSDSPETIWPLFTFSMTCKLYYILST